MPHHRSRTRNRLPKHLSDQLSKGLPRGLSPRLSQRASFGIVGGAVVVATGLTLASVAGADSDTSPEPEADYTVAASTDSQDSTAGGTGDTGGTGSPVVAFGDSYYSSPSLAEGLGNCGRSSGNWTRLAAEKTGREVLDHSCAGDTSETMLGRVRDAVDKGDLSDRTGSVVLAIGGNDFSHQKAVLGLPVSDLPGTRAKVLANIAKSVSMIRDAAPNAHLVFTGYLPSTDGSTVCRSTGPSIEDAPLNDVETYINGTMQLAADAAGATFVNVRDAAKGNSTCSAIGTRFVSGDEDGSSDVLLKWHPTEAGNRFMADLITPQL
jgi:lysophospholipase L1-like esterase